MRVKTRPEDFHVRELWRFDESRNGAYYLHVLRKEKMDTLSALAVLARETGVPREDIAFAGLKDRQGRTEQLISIRGRKVQLRKRSLQVRFVARADRPVTSKQSDGNRFSIVLRDLTDERVEALRGGMRAARRLGFPNYFDDQRFGCLRHGQGLVMRSVLRGDHQAALRGLIATPSRVALEGDRKLKRILRANWGDWETCAAIARGPAYRRVFAALLRDPNDFRGALQELPLRQRLIHAYAFQSFLWNGALSRYLAGLVPARDRVWIDTLAGRLLAWRDLPPAIAARLARTVTPMFGEGAIDGEGAFCRVQDRLARAQGVSLEACREHAVPGMRLRAEARAPVVVPRDLRMREARPGPGPRAVTLSFALPRGAYATMLIKCMAANFASPRGERPAPLD